MKTIEQIHNLILRRLLPLILLGLALTGCRRDDPDTCIRDVILRLQYNLDHYTDTILTTYANWPAYAMRFIVDVYPDMNNPSIGDRIDRVVHVISGPAPGFHEEIISMQMPDRKVKLLIWADFVQPAAQTDLYYTTTDLRNVRVISPSAYNSGIYPKDAFVADTLLNPLQESGNPAIFTVPIRTPFAKYKIISGDVQKYLLTAGNPPINQLNAIVAYHYFFPIGYDVYTGDVNHLQAGIGYTLPLSQSEIHVNADSLVVACDYVFVSKSSSGILQGGGTTVNYDALAEINLLIRNGGIITGLNNVPIRLKRGWMTLVRGDFLTTKSTDIGIDDNFDGEIIIPIL